MNAPDRQPNTAAPINVMAVLEEFYTHHSQELFYFCYRRLNDVDVANDAVGRIMLKALNNLDSFTPHPESPGATIRAWLYHIARNDLIDQQRVRKQVQSLDRIAPSGQPFHDPPDTRHGPEHQAIQRDAERRLREVLIALPESQRAIVELRLAGLTGSEIAETLDLTMSAMKSAQFRAFNKLRDLLSDTDLDPRVTR